MQIDPPIIKIANLRYAKIPAIKLRIKTLPEKIGLNGAILPPGAKIRLNPPHGPAELPEPSPAPIPFLLLVEES